MDVGLCESLLTERLNAALVDRPDLEPTFSTVDDAEQALTIARHLTPLIGRQLKAAGSAEARAQLLRNILAVLGDADLQQEVLHLDDSAKIRRLDAVRMKPSVPRCFRVPRHRYQTPR